MALEKLEELKWKFLTKLLYSNERNTLTEKKLRIVLNSGSKSWNLGYNVQM